MEETCRGNRTILIVDLLPPGVVRVGQYTDQLCRQTYAESTIEPTYEILYIPVPFKEPISKHLDIESTKTSTPCDGLIIYARTKGLKEVLEAMEANIISFCKSVITFKNTVIFIDFGTETAYSKRIPEYFKKYNVTGVTCLNIQVRDAFIKTYSYKDSILLFVPEHIYNQPGTSVVCTWWFEYYVGKIFSCGTGRLVQYSGTCYLNAVVNGIILSNHVSSMVLMYMNMAVQADRTGILISLIKEGAKIGECPRSFNEVLFLYRLMYSVYCSDIRSDIRRDIRSEYKRSLPRQSVEQTKADYLLSGDQWYSETLLPVINPSEFIQTNGGGSMFTLYQMLSSMRVKFVVKAQNSPIFFMPQLYDLRMPDPQDPEGRRHMIDEFSIFISELKPALNSYVRDCDIILDIFPSQVIGIEMTITAPEGKDFHKDVGSDPPEDYGEVFMDNGDENGDDNEDPEEPLGYEEDPDPEYFDLQFGTIALVGDEFSHAILGYLCNGKPQTYDSGTNKINFSDWTALNNPEVKSSLLQDVATYHGVKSVTVAYTVCCIYLSRNKIPEYTTLGRCPV